jgi:hypothetical protein
MHRLIEPSELTSRWEIPKSTLNSIPQAATGIMFVATECQRLPIELFVDGKSAGALENREIAMKWNIERVGIYFAINYIGLMDELVIFRRALSNDEIEYLKQRPAGLKIELLVKNKQ